MITAVEILKKMEWGGTYSQCTGWPCCPVCKGIKPGHGRDENGVLPDNQGHRKNCDLAAAITAPNALCPECTETTVTAELERCAELRDNGIL